MLDRIFIAVTASKKVFVLFVIILSVILIGGTTVIWAILSDEPNDASEGVVSATPVPTITILVTGIIPTNAEIPDSQEEDSNNIVEALTVYPTPTPTQAQVQMPTRTPIPTEIPTNTPQPPSPTLRPEMVNLPKIELIKDNLGNTFTPICTLEDSEDYRVTCAIKDNFRPLVYESELTKQEVGVTVIASDPNGRPLNYKYVKSDDFFGGEWTKSNKHTFEFNSHMGGIYKFLVCIKNDDDYLNQWGTDYWVEISYEYIRAVTPTPNEFIY